MTAETTQRPVRTQSFRQRMVGRWIMLATVTEVLRDRRFQEKAITVVIGAVALAQLGRDNQARPVRRAASWYSKLGVKEELAKVGDTLELAKVTGTLELAKIGEALDAGKEQRRLADGEAQIAHRIVPEASQPSGSVPVCATADGTHADAVDLCRDGGATGGQAQGVAAGGRDAS